MYVNVIVLTNTGKTDQLYTYRYVGEEINLIGRRVEIPFGRGNKKRVGIIVETLEEAPKFSVKTIHDVIDDKPLLDDELLALARYMVRETLCNYTQAIRAVMPPGVELRPDSKDLQLPKKRYYRYNPSFTLDNLSKRAYKQWEIMRFLMNKSWVAEDVILKAVDTGKTILDRLVEKNAIEVKEKVLYRQIVPEQEKYEKLSLNFEQQQAYDEILNKGEGVFLLKGVTGSGKTEVYLHLVEHALKKGQDSIVLVPEIALTPQTIERFAGRFGEKVAVLHSKLSYGERLDQWMQIRKGEVKIVVGARSAIFAPFSNLGVIIIDEEHEDSYQADRSPKYDARDIGEQRARYHKIPLVLGSATPRMESYYRANQGEFQLLELTQRVYQQRQPDFSLVDMRQELKEKNNSMFSRLLYYEMQLALRKEKQILLFLNKRGHSSFVFCRNCGYAEKCDSCDVSMTYHRYAGRLICHYCGKTKVIPKTCPVCGSNAIRHFGAGTEQVEEYTRQLFPDKRIARMDFDTTRQKNAYEELYKKMQNRKIDILIGTQMIAKGLDFEHVSLVGVLAADISLNLPNYKASEKTFQLITQVAGRAGRGKDPGKVIVQTYNPDHFAIQASRNYDYERFYYKELQIRKAFHYPPYYDILLIGFQGKVRRRVEGVALAVASALRQETLSSNATDVILVGPNPSQIPKIKDRFRYQLLLKTKESYELIKQMAERVSINNEYGIDFQDVDISVTVKPGVIL